jgi:hypothetical protein
MVHGTEFSAIWKRSFGTNIASARGQHEFAESIQWKRSSGNASADLGKAYGQQGISSVFEPAAYVVSGTA